MQQHLNLPPHSLPAVLAGLLIDNQAFDLIAGKVAAIDFYCKSHQYIYRAIERLAEKQEPFDIVTLTEKLKEVGKLDAVGGLDYLVKLASDIPSAANISAYAGIVRDRAKRREVIHACTKIVESALSDTGIKDLLETAEQSLFAISDKRESAATVAQLIKSLLAKTLDKLEHLHEKGDPITGIATGFNDLDNLTTGLQPADLVIVAGRPSMGKTSVAMNIAEHVALHNAQPVLVFSMEMPADALTMCLLSSLGRIDANVFVSGVKDSVAKKAVDYLYEYCPPDSGVMIFRRINHAPGYEIQGIGDTRRSLVELSGLQLVLEKDDFYQKPAASISDTDGQKPPF